MAAEGFLDPAALDRTQPVRTLIQLISAAGLSHRGLAVLGSE